ncbi:hypothetical protein O181_060539 [Austropuccinia psidii MF-1]|uniref:Uncharacterized protein n=1 Tax=Austropuccinia psidii MF-1 TaxID=1389203 RepID=A0A9Q3HZQ8_9BASI|nr:hypothetical protein [Austropuccinia psidii MF-1]
MKESGQVSLYIADCRSLMSRIGDWGERAYINVYRRGLESILLDRLASNHGNFDSLQELMDITLELDTSSSSRNTYHRKNKKGKNFQVSKDKTHAALLTKDNKLIGSEKERRIKEGLCNYCGGKHPFEKFFKRPENSILIHSGATNSFIAKNVILKYSLTKSDIPEKIPLFILDSNESTSLFITHYTKWVVDLPSFPSFEWDFFIIDSPKGEDLILGSNFLYHFNPIINWKNGLITYDSSHKDSSGITSSTSNDFGAAFNSVALVGGLNTPSLPSFPLIHYFCQEMKDVVEYVAISSLHLFQGNMNLPPLSFHASLEEHWDEEEEPE